MKWLAVMFLVLVGLVEFVLRAAVLLALCAVIVGTFILLEQGMDALTPTLWKMADSVITTNPRRVGRG